MSKNPTFKRGDVGISSPQRWTGLKFADLFAPGKPLVLIAGSDAKREATGFEKEMGKEKLVR